MQRITFLVSCYGWPFLSFAAPSYMYPLNKFLIVGANDLESCIQKVNKVLHKLSIFPLALDEIRFIGTVLVYYYCLFRTELFLLQLNFCP